MGLITNIDDNGRIQLPLAIRYGLHLLAGDIIAVDQLGDGTIILKKIEEKEILGAAEMSEISITEREHSKDIRLIHAA
ncbi:MAG TPA: AbrB/MazE/SpoVT family DNA-binding domain-containing protein [Methanothrix sp.]|jgi:AbrB family looped-hinge helix DNA binding protein|nr:AbrB/MazE/SpoVT family DNA-binding domain-containing protein [Methanothrix sp.]